MAIQVDAYMAGGVASGILARPGHLREHLEHDGVLNLVRVTWQPLGGSAASVADVSIPIDDVLIAVSDDDPTIHVHATWHGIRLDVGPYTVEGEMATLPGFDPGRSLTRPTGEFVSLRDVRVGLREDPAEPPTPLGRDALVNRYVVDTVMCDLILGFYFPGAEIIQADVAETGIT